VTLHVASHAEGLPTPGVRALEGLLARVGVTVDPERAGSGEGLVACLANVAILRLGERCRGGRGNVVVMLPRVGSRGGRKAYRHWHGREGLREWPLVVHPTHLRLGRRSGLHGRVIRGHRGLAHVRRGSKLRLVRRSLDLVVHPGNGGHVSLVHVAQWRRSLEVVVGRGRELADGLGRRRVVSLKRGI